MVSSRDAANHTGKPYEKQQNLTAEFALNISGDSEQK
jgi:hypothetical protein